MSGNVPYETIPSGWYAIAESPEVRRGRVKAVRYFDRDLIVYRTESGVAQVSDAYCPHLGAHLGEACVRGERLRCPFHGFEFGLDGACVSTPYPGGRPPPKARLGVVPAQEKYGFVFAYYDRDGRMPTWETPALDLDGFTDFRVKSFRFRGHPQEVSENSSDLGHFAEVHGYSKAEVLGEPKIDGHVLRATYAVERSLDFVGLPGKTRLQFSAEVHGLGYSVVRAKFPQLRIDTWLLVLPTPVDVDHVHLRVASAMRPYPVPSPLMKIIHRFVLEAFSRDVADDIPLWSKKRYVERPLLAPGDGPIATYRRYAEQFYPPRRVALSTVGDTPAD